MFVLEGECWTIFTFTLLRRTLGALSLSYLYSDFRNTIHTTLIPSSSVWLPSASATNWIFHTSTGPEPRKSSTYWTSDFQITTSGGRILQNNSAHCWWALITTIRPNPVVQLANDNKPSSTKAPLSLFALPPRRRLANDAQLPSSPLHLLLHLNPPLQLLPLLL